MVYKRNPFLMFYPDYSLENPSFVAENPVTTDRFKITDKRLFDLLAETPDWMAPAEIKERFIDRLEISDDQAETVIEQLSNSGILVCEDDDTVALEKEISDWIEYNWEEALFYYLYGYNYPFLDYSEGEAFFEDDERMDEYINNEEIPPIYKTYEEADLVELPEPADPEKTASIASVMDTSYSSPGIDESKGIVDAETLSTVFYYTFGQTETIEFPLQGKFIQKTSPSGGARHPTEAYVAILDVDGISSGVYHYSVKDHALNILDQDDPKDRLEDTIYELEMGVDFDISFVVVFTSKLERSMWRYRESRTYRVILNDIGHLIETLKLSCISEDLYTYFGHGFNDQQLEAMLGIDGLEEPAFKFAAVGR